MHEEYGTSGSIKNFALNLLLAGLAALFVFIVYTIGTSGQPLMGRVGLIVGFVVLGVVSLARINHIKETP